MFCYFCVESLQLNRACGLSIETYRAEDVISIFPDPAKNELSISSKVGTIEEIIIYTLTGQQVFNETGSANIIDVSILHPGMYIIEVVSEKISIREKLMIEWILKLSAIQCPRIKRTGIGWSYKQDINIRPESDVCSILKS